MHSFLSTTPVFGYGALALSLVLACSPEEPPEPIQPSENWTRAIEHTALSFDVSTNSGTAIITFGDGAGEGASLEAGDLLDVEVTSGEESVLFEQTGNLLHLGLGEAQSTVTIHYTYQDHPAWEGASGKGWTLLWPTHCGNLFPCQSDPALGLSVEMEVSEYRYFA